jgi:hypothetical protein
MGIVENMLSKVAQMADQLRAKWIAQVKYTVNQNPSISKHEIIAKFKSDRTRMSAVEALGWSDRDVEELIDEALKD